MPSPLNNIPDVDFTDPLECEEFIKRSFSGTPQRLRHILVVADRVRQSARDLNERGLGFHVDESLAYCAALVHDIGYLEPIAETGFHPLDGASFLERRGYGRLAELVIGHSSAPEEARLLGLDTVNPSDDLVAKLITYWDSQVRQGGEETSYVDRCRDILARYGETSIVGRATLLAQPRIQSILDEVNRLLGEEPS